MGHLSAAPGEAGLAWVPVATWSDGTTVQSVVLPGAGRAEHEYWVVHDGQVLARFASLAAVEAWRAEQSEAGAGDAE